MTRILAQLALGAMVGLFLYLIFFIVYDDVFNN